MDIEADKKKLTECVAFALDKATQLGASQAEVAAGSDEGLVASVRKNEVETVEFTKNHSFGITVYNGKAKGSSGTTDLTLEAIEKAVSAAWDIAQYTSEDPHAGLPDAEDMATSFLSLDLDHPWEVEPQQAIEMALQCESAGMALQGITNSEGATLSSGRGVRLYGNSHGFLNSTLGTGHGLSCSLIAGKGDTMQRDYWSTRHRVPEKLLSPEAVGRTAAERALARLNPKKMHTGTYPVIFSAPLAGGLVGHVLSAIAGSNLYRKSSFLLDKLDSKIASDSLSIYEMPHLPQAASSAACDSEGLPTREKYFVENGFLTSYVLSTYSGRRLGMKSTANAGGARNVRIHDSGKSYHELLKTMDRGVLVTELMGQGVNMVTGDYSRGAAGFWVENGQIQYPIHEFTIAGNLSDMLSQIQLIGNDVDERGNIQTGSILLDALTIAGDNSADK
ncbi:MAG: metalloprotease PmbA [Pseudomonadales bacterium]|nr:metalloprotease PmbA [Pseudomonadales bacterium]